MVEIRGIMATRATTKNQIATGWFSFLRNGTREDGTVRPMGKPDYWLISFIAMLVVLGLVMVYSSSFVTASIATGKPDYYLWRHLTWIGIGGVAMLLFTLIDYHWLRRFSIAAMLVVLGLLFAILILPSNFAPSRYGAKRWLTPFGEANDLQFQPSEIAKAVLIVYAAHWLTSKGDKIKNFYYGLVPFALTIGFLIALVMGQPDLGTSLVIGSIGLGMFFIAGANILHMLAGLSVAGVGFYVLSTTAAYRLARWQAYLNPFQDPTGLSWHSQGNLMALGTGGWFGTGLGASRQKFLWLPNVFTDSIFAVIGEELGLIGASLVVLLFVALAWRGMQVAVHAPDAFGRLIAAGVTIYVVSQALLNIAVTANLVPFTGIPLPLISYGGTSLAVTMACIGLLLNVSRQMIPDPRRQLIEERRREDKLRQELHREQKAAEQARREAQARLLAAEEAEMEREETERAAKEWHNERRRQELNAWQERAEAAAERRQHQTQAAHSRLRQRDNLAGWRQPADDVAPFDRDDDFDDEELPAVATHSFRSFARTNGKMRLETIGDEDESDDTKPKLRKPRRDWAKTYESRHKRGNE